MEVFAVDAEACLEGAALLLGPEGHRVGGRNRVHPLPPQRLLNVVPALQQQVQGLHSTILICEKVQKLAFYKQLILYRILLNVFYASSMLYPHCSSRYRACTVFSSVRNFRNSHFKQLILCTYQCWGSTSFWASWIRIQLEVQFRILPFSHEDVEWTSTYIFGVGINLDFVQSEGKLTIHYWTIFSTKPKPRVLQVYRYRTLKTSLLSDSMVPYLKHRYYIFLPIREMQFRIIHILNFSRNFFKK